MRQVCGANVEIYDNDFQFIRDNPVEPEDEPGRCCALAREGTENRLGTRRLRPLATLRGGIDAAVLSALVMPMSSSRVSE